MEATTDIPAIGATPAPHAAPAGGDGVLVLRDGRWRASPTAQRLLGLEDELLPPVEELRLRTLGGEPVASGAALPSPFRVRARALDGRELVLEGSWASDWEPLVVFHDATERHQREHWSAEFLRTLLDTIPTAVNVVDPETRRVVATNRAFLDLVGLELDAVLDASQPYPWWAEGEAWRPSEDGDRYARAFRRPDGRTIPVEIALRTVRDRDGGVNVILGVITDLSERRRFEQQLAQSGKLAAIGELAAGVAHEINNPLFAVLGLVEFALRDLEPGTKAHDRLQLVSQTALEIKEIVRALLDFARESSDTRREVGLDAVAGETVELVRRTSVEHGVELIEDYAGGPYLVHGSPNQLKQIFLNLIANSRQAMPGGGTIRLRVAGDEEWVEATVSDTGPGIPAELEQRVFEPFFTTRRGEGGTGLGLSVSVGIAEAHGGSLTASSQSGSGACFTLRLPRPGRGA